MSAAVSSDVLHAIDSVLDVIWGTVKPNPQVTLRQFAMVLYAIKTGGATQTELAELTGCSKSAISKSYAGLGPDGSGCLQTDSRGKVVADQHVLDAFEAIFASKQT